MIMEVIVSDYLHDITKKILTILTAISAIFYINTAFADNDDNSRAPELNSFVEAALYGSAHPYSKPTGADDLNCKTTILHPKPVILLAGTFATSTVSWGKLSPLLKQQRYCVFAPNLGQTGRNISKILPALGYVEDIPVMAQELKQYVDKLVKVTGHKKFDLVGYSLGGGLLPRWYLHNLGGDKFIDKFIGVAPSNYGTDVDGLGSMVKQLDLESLVESIAGKSPAQQLYDTEIVNKLAALPAILPGIEYTTIHTKYDEVVTPWETGQKLRSPKSKSLLVQDYCKTDFSDHLGVTYDPVALQLVINILDPTNAKTVGCEFIPSLFK